MVDELQTDLAPPDPAPSANHARASRAVVALGAAIAAPLIVALAPMVVREAPTSGPVFETAAPLSGQGREATQALRGLGFHCADSAATEELVTRVCAKVEGASSSRVQLVVVADGGALKLARTSLEQSDRGGRDHGDIAVSLARAVGLTPAEQQAMEKAATSGSGATLTFGWGSFALSSESGVASELRAAQWDQDDPRASTVTFAASVDALADAATARGYKCFTPTVDNIRSCSRNTDGYGYGYDLWLQGTDTYVTTVELSVTAAFRTQTRSRWVEEMLSVLRGVDTDQARNLATWLERSADAPGADTYVDGVPISFRSRPEQGTKETFGGISAECGRAIDDISSCAP